MASRHRFCTRASHPVWSKEPIKSTSSCLPTSSLEPSQSFGQSATQAASLSVSPCHEEVNPVCIHLPSSTANGSAILVRTESGPSASQCAILGERYIFWGREGRNPC